MSSPEDGEKVTLRTRFLKQEIFTKRGKSSCYATSVVNASIAVGAISPEGARAVHDVLLDDLVAVPDLWNGAVQRIRTQDTRIAEIIEEYVPVRIGEDTEIGRLMLVPRTYGQIWRDLVTQRRAHVITVPEAVHAYAVVSARENGEIVYIDPLDPYSHYIGNEHWFARNFHPDNNGWVNVTPVMARVRVTGESWPPLH